MLIYEVHHPHIFQVDASNPALEFPADVVKKITRSIRDIIRDIVTLHPERRRFDFTEKHYGIVANYVLLDYPDVRYAFGIRSFHFRH